MINRREFVWTSSAALAAGVFGPSFVFAQAPAAPAPPTTPVFMPLRRNVGIFTARGGTMGYIVNPDAVMVIDSQFADTVPDVPGRLEDPHAAADRHPAQHASPRRPYWRQQGTAARRDQDRRASERARAAAEGGGRGEERGNQAYADEDVHRRVEGECRRRDRVGKVLRRRAHQRRRRLLHRARQHRAHGRLDVAPAPPARGPAVGRLDPQLADDARERGQGPQRRHDLHLRPLQGGRAGDWQRKDLLALRDYFTAMLDYVQKGIAAGKSAEEIVKGSVPGFADSEGMPQLQVAYDELTNKV